MVLEGIMGLQDRLKAARDAKGKFAALEPAPETETAAIEVEPPPVLAKKNQLELDSASQSLLEENPIVPDAGEPAKKPVTPPNTPQALTAPTPANNTQNPLVWLGGALAAGLLILGGVMVAQRPKPVPFYNPMPKDHAPVPVAPKANQKGLISV
jgi:hypothetical protein